MKFDVSIGNEEACDAITETQSYVTQTWKSCVARDLDVVGYMRMLYARWLVTSRLNRLLH